MFLIRPRLRACGLKSRYFADRLARENDRVDLCKRVPLKLREIIDSCLQPRERPTAAQLLQSHFGGGGGQIHKGASFPSMRLRSAGLDLDAVESEEEEEEEEDPLSVLTMHETYYLWKLAGGDVLGAVYCRYTPHPVTTTTTRLLLLCRRAYQEGSLGDPSAAPLSPPGGLVPGTRGGATQGTVDPLRSRRRHSQPAAAEIISKRSHGARQISTRTRADIRYGTRL